MKPMRLQLNATTFERRNATHYVISPLLFRQEVEDVCKAEFADISKRWSSRQRGPSKGGRSTFNSGHSPVAHNTRDVAGVLDDRPAGRDSTVENRYGRTPAACRPPIRAAGVRFPSETCRNLALSCKVFHGRSQTLGHVLCGSTCWPNCGRCPPSCGKQPDCEHSCSPWCILQFR